MHIGRHTTFWLAVVAAALLLQACENRPLGPTARVFAADMAGGAKACSVPAVTPAAGQTTDAQMKVSNDGGWCAISVRNGGKPFGAGLLVAEPAHGKVVVHTVGDDTRIDYTPTARFTGGDSFAVRLVPGDATIRVAVSVTP